MDRLDRETLAAFGAASVDHSAATAGFHADQKAMGTGATGFGRLVSAFHVFSNVLKPCDSGKPRIISKFRWVDQLFFPLFLVGVATCFEERLALWIIF